MQSRMLSTSRFWSTAVLITAATLGGCKSKADMDKVPEVAEVKTRPGEIKVEPDKIEMKPAEVSLEEKFPLRKGDIGKTFYVAGTVVGTPGPLGFFLKTEGNEVIFINTTTSLMAGQAVRAVGTLNQAKTAEFKGWKKSMLGRELKAEWKLQDLWYLDASAVQSM